MKCESCHKAEAKMAVTVHADGTEKEIYVCPSCAARLRGKERSTPAKTSRKTPPEVTVINGNEENPPPFVEELVKATLGFMKGVAEAEENEKHVCPVCKTKWDQVLSSGRVGCPACWKTFARKIRDNFLAGEWGSVHVGGAPTIDHIPDPAAARAALERELKDAVAREDYRRAAVLKRRIDDLPDEKDSAT